LLVVIQPFALFGTKSLYGRFLTTIKSIWGLILVSTLQSFWFPFWFYLLQL
jgi:hypothetical protein